MITEDYCSFEVAKLLKEKGFNGQYHMYYIEDGIYRCDDLHDIKDYAKSIAQFDYLHRTKVIAPTLQTAMKWLREVHNLSVEVYRTACGYVGCIVAIPSGTDIKFFEKDGDDLPSGQYTTWEKACEAALMYSLENLI